MEGASCQRIHHLFILIFARAVSILHQIFLTPPGPLRPPPDLPLTPQPYLESVQKSRQEYTRLLLEKMKAPDGSYEDGFLVPGKDTPPERTGKGSSNLERNNPLSLHDEVDLLLLLRKPSKFLE